MKRTIIKIDEYLCNGCGECVTGCHEGALQIIDGKAKLINETFCDGIGACIGDCPTGALMLEDREADLFNEEAVFHHMEKMAAPALSYASQQGCPGSSALLFNHSSNVSIGEQSSQLQQWPVQLHLLSPTAPYLNGADILLSADCVAYAVGNFHRDYLKDKRLAIACPKLDSGLNNYIDKLIAMIEQSHINTLTVMTMEVPCCNGLLEIAKEAVKGASRNVPLKWIKVGLQGNILYEEWL